MVMDPRFGEFDYSINGFGFDDDAPLPNFDLSPDQASRFKFKNDSLDINLMDFPSFSPNHPGSFAHPSSVSTELDSPDDHDSDPVFKYLNQILIEENLEEKPCMFHDPLALQAAERSFYEVLGEKYPPSPNQPPLYINQNAESPDSFYGSSSDYSISSSTSTSNSTDPRSIVDPVEDKPFVEQNHPVDYSIQSTLQTNSKLLVGSGDSLSNSTNGSVDSYVSTRLVPNIFVDSESIMLFKRGMEEANKFLPSGNQLIIDLDNHTLPYESKEVAPDAVVKVEKDDSNHTLNSSKVRKHHHREDSGLEEERSSKQSAVYSEEAELSDMFDRVLLCTDVKGKPACCDVEEVSRNEDSKSSQQNGQHHGSKGGKNRAKKQGDKQEAIDLRTLLISCAQSVAADDRRTAIEQLKQIRQHASPTGDASQRLAHIFAYGLEARLAGTGSQICAVLASKRISAAEKLKAYQLYLSICPFKKISIFFANKMIYNAASTTETLHLIDFGILYGFQWPILIQHLSNRPGGPPKLRITGIELPLPGFRPSERLEETGRRLENYCKRFNVPFEYHAIAAQHWEAIKIEDLKIQNGEVIAVNSHYRFHTLLDETVVLDSPRDAVLNLIRRIKPDIFVQAVINGSYSAPFFVTRFREALFHYSALFDMFDSTIPREDQLRLTFEKEFLGREAINVIACEGLERIERPETYKQWQVRNTRVGFKILPLNQELMKKLRSKVKNGYHKDFVFDEDGSWMLQGWKGRILYACSCWIPA